MPRNRPKWERKIPKIQAFVLLIFSNLEPLENWGKMPRNRPKWEQKMPKIQAFPSGHPP